MTLQFHQPFRPDALSLLSWWANQGHEQPPVLISFVAAAAASALALWRLPRTPAGFGAAVGMTLCAFFVFNKQAFCNYYFFVVGALYASVAAWHAPGGGRLRLLAKLAAPPGVLEDEVDVRRRLGDHEDLIREQRPADPDQQLVDRSRGPAERRPLPSTFGNGAGTPRISLIRKPGVDQQPPQLPEGEQPRVRAVEDARLAVVELPEQRASAAGSPNAMFGVVSTSVLGE